MNSTQYAKLNSLLAEFSTISAALEAAEAEIKTVQLAAATELLPKHAQAKIKLTDLEAQLRALANTHYEDLFGTDEKRTHKTPFGELKFHKSSSLEFADEEKVLLKIKLACQDELAREAEGKGHTPRFFEEILIRTHEEPNLATLDALDDPTLALFGITRVHKDTFTAKPFAMKSDKPAKAKKEAA